MHYKEESFINLKHFMHLPENVEFTSKFVIKISSVLLKSDR